MVSSTEVESRPVFLHRGMRTGGTALVRALQQLPALNVVYGVLHPSLALPFAELKQVSSDDWSGNHPPAYHYWASLEQLDAAGVLADYQPAFSRTYHLQPDEDRPELRHYLERVIGVLSNSTARPVVCFERSEGLVHWMRRWLPSVVHVGLTRDLKLVYRSWLAQALIGNWGFFDTAAEALRSAPEFFGPGMDQLAGGPVSELPTTQLRALFEAYNNRTDSVRRHEMDASVDVSDFTATTESGQTHLRQLAVALRIDLGHIHSIASEMAASGPGVGAITELERFLAANQRLNQQIQLLTVHSSDLQEALDFHRNQSEAYEQARDFWAQQASRWRAVAQGTPIPE